MKFQTKVIEGPGSFEIPVIISKNIKLPKEKNCKEIFRKWKIWNAKLIYSASSSKFGGNEDLSPYSWVKAKMVELIKNYSEWYGLNYEVCYFYNVYGPKQIKKGSMSTVIGIFEDQYSKNKSLEYRNLFHSLYTPSPKNSL